MIRREELISGTGALLRRARDRVATAAPPQGEPRNGTTPDAGRPREASSAAFGLAMSSRLRAIGLRLPRGRQRPPRWLLAVAIAAIAAGAFFAIRSLPDDLEHFVWWPIAAIAVLVVPGVTLNGYEYLVTARLSGVTVRLLAAVRIAIYGTAANLLPLPGASLVRIEAMRRSGASLARIHRRSGLRGL